MARHIHLGDLRREMVMLQKDLWSMQRQVKEIIEMLTFNEGEDDGITVSK